MLILDSIEVNEEKHHHYTNEDGKLTYKNEDKHLFEKPHHLKNGNENTVISKTEENFTKKQAGVKVYLTCSECGKSFTYKSHLERHMKIHTGEKTFTCTQCGKSFIYKSHLERHVKIHTGEKTFTCSQCGKGFSQNSSLNDHLHSHSEVKSFSCDQCDKTFVYS